MTSRAYKALVVDESGKEIAGYLLHAVSLQDAMEKAAKLFSYQHPMALLEKHQIHVSPDA
jgi:hypothetical protein